MEVFFKNKTILILSPDRWGAMHISKHHYALELTGHCRKVFFLNPANPKLDRPYVIDQHDERENLFIVSFRPFFSNKLRFNFRPLFDLLMKFQVKKIINKLDIPIDVVWCFNRYAFSNLSWFKAGTRIYHPVDQVDIGRQVKVANTANVIFTVSDEILERFKLINVPGYIINHGLSQHFSKLCNPGANKSFDKNRQLRIGYVGNLFYSSLDRVSFMQIVQSFQHAEFSIWGPVEFSNSNVSGVDSPENKEFIQFLKSSENVVLNGVISPRELAVSIQDLDAFLVCLNLEQDPNLGSNHHKIMEYLSTGKVIISNTISAYIQNDIIAMTDDQTSIVELFGKVIGNLDYYNSVEMQLKRKKFALDNTYQKQIQRIGEILLLEMNL